ncbi:mannitol dehydrogenase family protein [Deltaproteobacteria bacterium Smac51]|nr:mannitol dehydrogenase family protein [Deltaproteobacteria bacterium Smac51]
MKLTSADLKNTRPWLEAGFTLPRFDRQAATAATLNTPQWIHFGSGNITRAFLAALSQKLLDMGLMETGLIVVAGSDFEIIDRIYEPHDNLSLLVTLKADGNIEKTVIGSIIRALKADSAAEGYQELKRFFRAPSLSMASFVITEKGYNLNGSDGELLSEVAADFAAGPAGGPSSYMARVSALLYERYLAGAYPLALVSMDNCSRNGDRLREAVSAFAERWADNGKVDGNFVSYVRDHSRLSFPWTMIDKITPRPDPAVAEMLKKTGFESADIIVTAKNTYVAPFVNAEECEYLVIEDDFPAGRLPLDKAGVIFTDRGTVEKIEKMKVGTCLNPLHTALAVVGCLLGFTRINAEMADPDLRKMVEIIGYREGLPTAVDPGIISPKAFMEEVLNVRFPNPFIPDTPQRIATDTSQKLAPRFGGTIKAYHERPGLNASDLNLIPFVQAAWCRYLLGLDDEHKPFEISPDPRLEELRGKLAGLEPGRPGPFHDQLDPILSDVSIFGLNLYEAGLGQKVEALFAEMMVGPGSVRRTLHRLVAA